MTRLDGKWRSVFGGSAGGWGRGWRRRGVVAERGGSRGGGGCVRSAAATAAASSQQRRKGSGGGGGYPSSAPRPLSPAAAAAAIAHQQPLIHSGSRCRRAAAAATGARPRRPPRLRGEAASSPAGCAASKADRQWAAAASCIAPPSWRVTRCSTRRGFLAGGRGTGEREAGLFAMVAARVARTPSAVVRPLGRRGGRSRVADGEWTRAAKGGAAWRGSLCASRAGCVTQTCLIGGVCRRVGRDTRGGCAPAAAGVGTLAGYTPCEAGEQRGARARARATVLTLRRMGNGDPHAATDGQTPHPPPPASA